jgi:hypothetical protein
MWEPSTPEERRQALAQAQAAASHHRPLPVWLTLAIVIAAMANVFAGIVFWAMKGWLLGVILSLIIPGFGAVSIVVSLLA